MSRSDYQQFTDFLGLCQPRYSKNNSEVTVETCQQNKRPIAMVYGVTQCFERIYDPELALECGTIFEELNKPFYPTGCSRKNREGCL
ncbi:MAG: spore coat associated protein CotJA [Clostridia bacterium]|nr:spore coat associated protein CotJA [Clostridia bacterium]